MRHCDVDVTGLASLLSVPGNSFSQNYGAMAQCRSSIEGAVVHSATFDLAWTLCQL
jgi:hypothetical protein